MLRREKDVLALLYMGAGAFLLLVVAVKCFFWAIVGFIGYKILDAGLRKYGYPPMSYWASWIRAQWRI